MKTKCLAFTFFFATFHFASAQNKTPAPVSVTQADVDLKNKTGDQKKDVNLPQGGAIVVKQGADYYPGGCGYRTSLGGLVKIYQICFFGLNINDGNEWSTALDAPAGVKKAYKFKLNFRRGVGGKKVSAAFSEGLSKTPAADKLEELDRQKFLGWISKLNIERDSLLELTFNDAKAFQIDYYQKANSLVKPETFASDNKNLARAIASIWLGAKPVSEPLKAELLKPVIPPKVEAPSPASSMPASTAPQTKK